MTVERLTLAQIATSSLAAARVLERHGIDYCRRAANSLRDVCVAGRLDRRIIEQELTEARDDVPDERDWTGGPLRELMVFLRNEHAHFRTEIEALQVRMAGTAQDQPGVRARLQHLGAVFVRLCDELNMHMEHEEGQVFPAVERYLAAIDQGIRFRGSPLSAFGGPLRMMETEHEITGAALRLLREFAQNYEIPEDVCPRYEMLVRGMLALEDRLLRHMYLENNILFPRAAKLKLSEARLTG